MSFGGIISMMGAAGAGGATVAQGNVMDTILGGDRTNNWGKSVAVSEDGTYIAFGEYTAPRGYSYGRIYVYKINGDGDDYDLQQTITPFSSINARSGNSISMDGDGSTLVIGKYYDNNNTGKVYIYTRSNTTWSNVADFVASNAGSGDEFGSNVAINKDGNTIAVTAPNEDSNASNSGALYVFTGSGNSWSQQSGVLKSNTPTQNDMLGGYYDEFDQQLDISNDGNTIVVGEQNDHQGQGVGKAVIFVRSGTSWSHQATLGASDQATGTTSDRFANHVAISGDGNTVAGGAPHHNNREGATYVFTRSGTSWSQQANIEGENDDDYFGSCMSFNEDGNALLIGALNYNSSRGRVYLYERSGTSWSKSWHVDGTQEIQAGDAGYFGSQVELSNNGLVAVGVAPGWDQSYAGENKGMAKIIV